MSCIFLLVIKVLPITLFVNFVVPSRQCQEISVIVQGLSLLLLLQTLGVRSVAPPSRGTTQVPHRQRQISRLVERDCVCACVSTLFIYPRHSREQRCISTPTTGAVSYTHLDVYKRQAPHTGGHTRGQPQTANF